MRVAFSKGEKELLTITFMFRKPGDDIFLLLKTAMQIREYKL